MRAGFEFLIGRGEGGKLGAESGMGSREEW